jgi:hypothetical protein
VQCAGLTVQQVIDGPSVFIPALSFRQPFASLVLYGIKQLEARNRPTLKQMQGPLALHVSHREEPWNSPLLSAAVSLLRRRYSDESVCKASRGSGARACHEVKEGKGERWERSMRRPLVRAA